jgi:hypothetical protein
MGLVVGFFRKCICMLFLHISWDLDISSLSLSCTYQWAASDNHTMKWRTKSTVKVCGRQMNSIHESLM